MTVTKNKYKEICINVPVKARGTECTVLMSARRAKLILIDLICVVFDEQLAAEMLALVAKAVVFILTEKCQGETQTVAKQTNAI